MGERRLRGRAHGGDLVPDRGRPLLQMGRPPRSHWRLWERLRGLRVRCRLRFGSRHGPVVRPMEVPALGPDRMGAQKKSARRRPLNHRSRHGLRGSHGHWHGVSLRRTIRLPRDPQQRRSVGLADPLLCSLPALGAHHSVGGAGRDLGCPTHGQGSVDSWLSAVSTRPVGRQLRAQLRVREGAS